MLDNLERREARLLLKFEPSHHAEPVHLIDEARIVTHGNRPAQSFEFAQRTKPDLVVLLPVRLVHRRPPYEVRAMVHRVRLEVGLKGRMQIVLVPGLRLRPLQIPARFVDIERRDPRHIRLDHCGQHFLQLVRLGFPPESPRVTKAMYFVGNVEVGGEILHAVGNGRIGNAVPMFDAGGTILDVVPGVGLGYGCMVRHAQPDLVRFVHHGLHHVALDGRNLDAIDAQPLELLDTRSRFGGSIGRRWCDEKRIMKQPGSHHFARVDSVAQRDRLPRIAAHIAHTRYA